MRQEQIVQEQLIKAMNEQLAGSFPKELEDYQSPVYPVVFLIGAPRTGTTLLMQLLAAQFHIGYINNLTARFWKAPYFGAALTQVLRAGRSAELSLKSTFGATQGYDEPHEFSYFWRRWFPYAEDHHYIAPEQWKDMDMEGLRKEVAWLEALWKLPMFFKNPADLPLQISLLDTVFPKSIFINTERKPVDQVASMLEGREKYAGSTENWFGIRPPNYAQLRKLPVYEQIVGQIVTVKQEIGKQLQAIPTERKLTINYEDLCQNPGQVLDQVADKVAQLGFTLSRTNQGLPKLESRSKKIPDDLAALFSSLYKKFEDSFPD